MDISQSTRDDAVASVSPLAGVDQRAIKHKRNSHEILEKTAGLF